MTLFGFYIVCMVLAGLALIFLQWWDMKQTHNQYGAPRDPKDRQLTLKDLIIGILITICPVINTLVAGGCLIYIFSEIAPKIVLFGEQK